MDYETITNQRQDEIAKRAERYEHLVPPALAFRAADAEAGVTPRSEETRALSGARGLVRRLLRLT